MDAGGAAALSFGRAIPVAPQRGLAESWRDRVAHVDWVPDLGARVGSGEWFRGAATCLVLCVSTYMLSPGFAPIVGSAPQPLAGAEWDQAHSQSIAPLAWGGDTGMRMAANGLVRPLAETPERPRIQLSATIGAGDTFAGALRRAGVSKDEAQKLADMVAGATALSDIKPGTRLDVTLGRRPSKELARPLEAVNFRARFDLALSAVRAGAGLRLDRHPIAIDHTPLRLEGLVGDSLYRSMRSAGVSAKAVETYIKAAATRVSVGRDIGSAARWEVISEQARAATGEVQIGQVLYVGLVGAQGKKLQLMQWADGGRASWFDASGTGERQGALGMPVNGHLTSGFGLRMHPILGYRRMHKGVDFGAPYGSPIHAAFTGTVKFAGHASGYGNFVKLDNGGGLGTGYGHMSRIVVRAGQHVVQGQVIGNVGNSGLSTGPHLHFEVYRNGQVVNPAGMSFTQMAQLTGQALANFRARLASLLSTKPAAQ